MLTNLIDRLPKNIFVVGTGGTGAEVVRRLRHSLLDLKAKYSIDLSEITVYLVDHDTVEAKNCWRQDFYFWEVYEYKVEALQKRFRDFLNIVAIPEAINRDSLPRLFNQQIFASNFLVISAIDHTLSTSQLYWYLKENAPRSEDISWTYMMVGGEIVEKSFKGQFRTLSQKVETSYVTSFLYGVWGGTPIVAVEPHNLTTVLYDPGEAFGRRSNGEMACGSREEDVGRQTSTMNYESATHITMMFEYLYMHGLVLPVINTESGVREASTPYLIDEVLFPEQFPELAKEISGQTLPEQELIIPLITVVEDSSNAPAIMQDDLVYSQLSQIAIESTVEWANPEQDTDNYEDYQGAEEVFEEEMPL